MTDTLTQDGVDSSPSTDDGGVNREAARAVDVVPYNFLRPHRISRDRQTTLEAVYGRFALSLQAVLSSRLRVPTDVLMSSVEQATFGEFKLSLANPCAAFVFDLGDGGPVPGAIDLGTDLAYYLVDRLFGGPGEASEVHRPPTPLERLVVKGIAEKALTLLAGAWSEYVTLRPSHPIFESTPEAMQVMSPEDSVLIANHEVRSGSFTGVLSVCLPLSALEGFLQEKPSSPQRRQTGEEWQSGRAAIEHVLRSAALPVAARFPACSLSMRDLSSLAVGSVIHTRHPIGAAVELHIGGAPRYHASVGQAQGHIGLRVTTPITDVRADSTTRPPRGQVL